MSTEVKIEGSSGCPISLPVFVLDTSYALNFSLAFWNKSFNEAMLASLSFLEAFMTMKI